MKSDIRNSKSDPSSVAAVPLHIGSSLGRAEVAQQTLVPILRRVERNPKSEIRSNHRFPAAVFGSRISDLALRTFVPAFAFCILSSGLVRAASNETNAQVVIPQSVFIQPNGPSDGKDPFFPKSDYPYHKPVTPHTTAAPTPEPIQLKLLGISLGEKPLAIINNQNFRVGDDLDVKGQTGVRIHIKCIDIKADSVTIELPTGEKQELRMRSKLF